MVLLTNFVFLCSWTLHQRTVSSNQDINVEQTRISSNSLSDIITNNVKLAKRETDNIKQLSEIEKLVRADTGIDTIYEKSRPPPNGSNKSRPPPNGSTNSRPPPNVSHNSRPSPNGSNKSRQPPNGSTNSGKQQLGTSCHQGENCRLPRCFCPSFDHPMDKTLIPQFINFGFTGALNVSRKDLFRTLFFWRRKNPNDCQISMTFYVSNNYTDYDFVKFLYDYNHEIGVSDDTGEMNKIVHLTDIPKEQITGWNDQFSKHNYEDEVDDLRNNGYKYKVYAYQAPRFQRNISKCIWPFILDGGKCSSMDQLSYFPFTSRKGLWEVPFVDVPVQMENIGIESYGIPTNRDKNYRHVFNLFLRRFEASYFGNRAPVGLYLHSNWLNNKDYFKALNHFITEILTRKDVYIVSVKKMLEWMKNPISNDRMTSWGCSRSVHKSLKTTKTNSFQNVNESESKTTNVPKNYINHQKSDKTPTSIAVTNSGSQKGTILAEEQLKIVDGCLQGENCKLPTCFCPTFEHSIKRNKIPQIVYFGFDDDLNNSHKQFYDMLFNTSRRNPNGCPITMSLFVSDISTEYDVVRYYYDKGHEIGVHSVTHRVIKTRHSLIDEAGRQIINIVTKAGIPRDNITGWRSPYLETVGDAQVEVLQALGLKYDISHVYMPNEKAAWPFTLDYSGWPFECRILHCPKYAHKGFWEVPINILMDIKNDRSCFLLDDCNNNPSNESEVLSYLWKNFEMNYRGNRSPFGLHFHPSWFFSGRFCLNAIDKFIRDILKLGDVYIVSVIKMLEWIQNPVEIDIQKFVPWGC